MDGHLKTDLVVDALEMALRRRYSDNVIYHSDQGCQYTSTAYRHRWPVFGLRWAASATATTPQSTAPRNKCESFFATLECELIDRTRYENRAEAKRFVFHYIEDWYNPHRRHSALDYLSLMNYERRYST